MSVEARLLGIAQDAGIPQAGCLCPTCARAHEDPAARYHVVCLGLVDHPTRTFWLVDATPDFPSQLYRLQRLGEGYTLGGIFLTHAHMGHYTGLIHLGREAMNTQELPVYATARMADFLRRHAPWSQLVALGNVVLHELTPNLPVQLTPRLRVTPVPVPHRDEWSDTVAYLVHGEQGALFFCPDADSWTGWPEASAAAMRAAQVCLVDATFFSRDEVAHRNVEEIPHPFVVDWVDYLASLPGEVVLVHLNHTNPLLQTGSEAHALVARAGLRVGREGDVWHL